MIIPLRHENMEGRRWPVISIALIVINVARGRYSKIPGAGSFIPSSTSWRVPLRCNSTPGQTPEA